MRPESLYPLFYPLTRLKGVGESIARAVGKAVGREENPCLRDLLFHLPAGMVDRRRTWPLSEAPAGETGTFVVTVEAHYPPPRGRYGSRRPYKVICSNETGELVLVYFNATENRLREMLPVGQRRVVSGVIEHFEFRAQMTHPDIVAPESRLNEVRIVEPVYPLSAGLTSRRLAGMVKQALALVPPLPEWLSAKTLAEHGWKPWRETLFAVHHPASAEDLDLRSPARLRLAYDEALAHQLYLAQLRAKMHEKAGRAMPGTGVLREEFLSRLPFTLTSGQQQVLKEIDADMASGQRMTRLVQGDVGSGKTVLALLACLRAVESGAQGAVMAPTEIIAQQHYETFTRLLFGLNVKVALLTGSTRGAAREAALSGLADGSVQIAVGTHALFQEKVSFHDLGLIVVDEQHRFGVGQRMALSAKGDAPHLLQMSATPIPRSLTLTLYGDMDCSLLTEKPAGRQPIVTRALPASRAGELTERLEQALARGGKAYWICPLIEDEGAVAEADVAAAEARYIEFKTRFGECVGLAHGRMKAEDRHKALLRFAAGEIKLLVATTVVEVGVDVPDATIIIIEQADRFGLSQLHQLRGRVGRGASSSSCVLLYGDNTSEEGVARLSILRESNDGFRIAEEDLRLRGGGDLLGTRQSGMPKFHFINLAAHRALVMAAREEASAALRNDPALAGERGQALQLLLHVFGYEYGR